MSSKSAKKKAKRKTRAYRDIELNIMPFIDVFSLLNTFLLMSAVFIAIGVIEVQIPFLSPAPPPPSPPEKSCDVKVDMEKEKIEATADNCKGVDPKKEFEVNAKAFSELHKYMVEIRRNNPEYDKVQFFTEDDVIWDDMAAVLDAIKIRLPGDPVIPMWPTATDMDKAMAQEFIFPKVVLASVIL